MAGSPGTARPLARPYGDTSVSDDARRARSGAPGQRSDQQSAKESARALPTLPHAARSAASFGAALDHLPPALGSRRSLPWSVPGIDRRADIETDVARVAISVMLPERPSLSLNVCHTSETAADMSPSSLSLSTRVTNWMAFDMPHVRALRTSCARLSRHAQQSKPVERRSSAREFTS